MAIIIHALLLDITTNPCYGKRMEHGTRARLLDLIRERDRTDMAFCGSMLLLTLRATYTPAVCGAFVLLG